MKQVPLNEVKDDLSRYLKLAATESIIITRHGVPAGLLIGIQDSEDLWEEMLLSDPRFKERIAQARTSLRAGSGKTLSEIRAKYEVGQKKAKPVKRVAKANTPKPTKKRKVASEKSR